MPLGPDKHRSSMVAYRKRNAARLEANRRAYFAARRAPPRAYICLVCESPFVRQGLASSAAATSPICSPECRAVWRTHKRQKNSRRRYGELRACAFCGTVTIMRNESRFCSRECANAAKRLPAHIKAQHVRAYRRRPDVVQRAAENHRRCETIDYQIENLLRQAAQLETEIHGLEGHENGTA